MILLHGFKIKQIFLESFGTLRTSNSTPRSRSFHKRASSYPMGQVRCWPVLPKLSEPWTNIKGLGLAHRLQQHEDVFESFKQNQGMCYQSEGLFETAIDLSIGTTLALTLPGAACLITLRSSSWATEPEATIIRFAFESGVRCCYLTVQQACVDPGKVDFGAWRRRLQSLQGIAAWATGAAAERLLSAAGFSSFRQIFDSFLASDDVSNNSFNAGVGIHHPFLVSFESA